MLARIRSWLSGDAHPPASPADAEAVDAEPSPPPPDNAGAGEVAPPSTPWRAAFAQALALGGMVILLVAAWLLLRPLMLLFVAIVIATALEPLVDRLARRLPRAVAVLVVYLALALALAGVGLLIAPSITDQADQLIEQGPALVQEGRELIDRWDPNGEARIAERLQSAVGRLGSTLAGVPLMLVTAATEVLIVVAMSVYWLIAAPSLRRFVLSLLPAGRRTAASDLLSEMGRTMGGYIRGAAIDGVIIGTLVYIGLLILGVEYPLVLALLVAIGELVPIIGPIAAAVPALAVALLDSPWMAVKVGIFYLVIQQIESNIVEPNVMAKQTDMPPLLVLFALLAGGAVAGLLGIIVAIPLAGALRVLTLRLVAPGIRRWTGAAEP